MKQAACKQGGVELIDFQTIQAVAHGAEADAKQLGGLRAVVFGGS